MAQNTPAQQLFDLLVTRGFDPKRTPAQSSENSEIISFKFISSAGKNYGTVVIMLGEDKNLELFSGDNLGRTMDSKDKTEWYSFQQQLKNFATRNFMTYKGQDISKLKYSMQGQAALSEGLYESWNGTKHVSWNGDPESVRLMIRHKRPMSIDEARYRQIESLFVETAEGERYKLPFRNLAGGRAMVEHVRQGGRPYDLRGAHIANMVEELNVLSRFRRASHGRVFEDDTANLVSQATAYHSGVSRALKGLGSARGYNAYFESWNPGEITEQELIIEDIKTLFVEQTIDSRIEQALPILARLQQQGTTMKEANIFEAWANQLVEGTWATPDTPEEQQQLVALLSQEFPVGADATNATEQLYSLVGDDVLFDQLQDLAAQDAAADCRSVVLARIKELSDNGIEGFDTVLAALKAGQIAATAPAAPPAPPVAESDGSCNYTAEGEHCPEHGLMECGSGMYEGTNDRLHPDTLDLIDEYIAKVEPDADRDELIQSVVDGYIDTSELEYALSEGGQDTIARLQELSGMKSSQTDMAESIEDNPVASAITRRILMQRSDLLSKYGPEKVTAAIDDVADFVGDTDEIGSSDVSGWIKQVEQSLAGMAEEVAVTTGNPPLEETTALQGQYGHSGKLQKFDEVEQDIVARLRELSGMIRPA